MAIYLGLISFKFFSLQVSVKGLFSALCTKLRLKNLGNVLLTAVFALNTPFEYYQSPLLRSTSNLCEIDLKLQDLMNSWRGENNYSQYLTKEVCFLEIFNIFHLLWISIGPLIVMSVCFGNLMTWILIPLRGYNINIDYG